LLHIRFNVLSILHSDIFLVVGFSYIIFVLSVGPWIFTQGDLKSDLIDVNVKQFAKVNFDVGAFLVFEFLDLFFNLLLI